MKKLLFAACAGVLLLSTACKNSESNYSKEEQALGDSIADGLGKMTGAYANIQLKQKFTMAPEYIRDNYDKDEYLKGLEFVLTSDTANIAFIEGLQAGVEIYQQFYGLQKELNLPIDVRKFIEAYGKSFKNDKIDQDSMMVYQTEIQKLWESVDKLQAERQAKEDVETQKFIENKLKSGYKKTQSGIVYKIDNPGKGAKVTSDDVVRLNYKGTHVNGSVFDQSTQPVEFYMGQMIPGFAEAASMLGEGGKGTFIIPAELAYGPQGVGEIKPNETLIFEIEILKINSLQEAEEEAAEQAGLSDVPEPEIEAEVAGSRP